MTCIIGLVDGQDVWMGADSCASNGFVTHSRRDPKLFRAGPFLVGFTHSWRMGQLLHRGLLGSEFPTLPTGSLHGWMVEVFVERTRDLFRHGGFLTFENGQEMGGEFLVAVRGQLFCVSRDFQVGEALDNFYVAGQQLVAIGAMQATRSLDLSPRRRIGLALQASVDYSDTVRPPFIIRCLVGSRNRRR